MFKNIISKMKNKNVEKDKKSKIKSSTRFTVLAIILIAIFCVALTPVTFQNDTYYTIKIGEHITQYVIDMQDPFSWHQDLAYTYPHWLYDLLTYLIYSAFGMNGIYITTCILSIILGITLYLTNNKLVKNQIFSFAITIGAMYLIRGYIAARAQLVTFILLVLTVYFIERFLETKKKRYALALIVIPILIANLHSAVFPFYFILYLPYIAEYIIAVLGETVIYRKVKIAKMKLEIKLLSRKNTNAEKIEKLKDELKQIQEKVDKIKIKRTKELQNPYKIKLEKNPNIKWLILIMIICAFTGLLTPLGDTPYTYLYKTMQGNTTENINEHLPMTLSEDHNALAAIVLILAIMTFTKTKIRLRDLFMIGGLCYLMLATKRQFTMFCIIGIFIVNKMICDLINIYTKKGLQNRDTKMYSSKIIWVLMIVIMLISSKNLWEDKKGNEYIEEKTYPVQAADFILNNIDLTKAKFYNEYNYGSYLIYRGIPVFIDSRADLYAPEFSGKKDDIFMDFINVSSIGTFYEDTFKKYGITHVIMYKNAKINMIIKKTKDSNYNKLYEDKHFVIYERLNV